MPDILTIKNVDIDTKNKLKEAAIKRVGDPNISKFVRLLIAEAINNSSDNERINIDFDGKKVRVPVSIVEDAVHELDKICDQRISTRNYYISSLVYGAIKNPQLLTDEIETLRRSNYQLAKIGSNLNQIARAFNILVLEKKDGKLPKLGKDIARLTKSINEHTKLVLAVLDSKMGMYIERRGGRRKRKQK